MRPHEVIIGQLYKHEQHPTALYVGAEFEDERGFIVIAGEDSVGERTSPSHHTWFWDKMHPAAYTEPVTTNSPSVEKAEEQVSEFPREDYERDQVIQNAADRIFSIYPSNPSRTKLAVILAPFFQTAVVDRDIKIQNLHAALGRKEEIIRERRSELNHRANEIRNLKGELENERTRIKSLRSDYNDLAAEFNTVNQKLSKVQGVLNG